MSNFFAGLETSSDDEDFEKVNSSVTRSTTTKNIKPSAAKATNKNTNTKTGGSDGKTTGSRAPRREFDRRSGMLIYVMLTKFGFV